MQDCQHASQRESSNIDIRRYPKLRFNYWRSSLLIRGFIIVQEAEAVIDESCHPKIIYYPRWSLTNVNPY